MPYNIVDLFDLYNPYLMCIVLSAIKYEILLDRYNKSEFNIQAYHSGPFFHHLFGFLVASNQLHRQYPFQTPKKLNLKQLFKLTSVRFRFSSSISSITSSAIFRLFNLAFLFSWRSFLVSSP